ncbi:MAG: NUDIX domain-containing protein [Promethearchaeota archaeon]
MNDIPPKYTFTADAVIVEKKRIVLIRRKNPPFQGFYALPGGFVDPDETVEQACIREAKEETSLDVEIVKLIGIYSDPKRDPRGRTITGAFVCKKIGGVLAPEDDAEFTEWMPIEKLKEVDLAFDHRKILEDAGLL